MRETKSRRQTRASTLSNCQAWTRYAASIIPIHPNHPQQSTSPTIKTSFINPSSILHPWSFIWPSRRGRWASWETSERFQWPPGPPRWWPLRCASSAAVSAKLKEAAVIWNPCNVGISPYATKQLLFCRRCDLRLFPTVSPWTPLDLQKNNCVARKCLFKK